MALLTEKRNSNGAHFMGKRKPPEKKKKDQPCTRILEQRGGKKERGWSLPMSEKKRGMYLQFEET